MTEITQCHLPFQKSGLLGGAGAGMGVGGGTGDLAYQHALAMWASQSHEWSWAMEVRDHPSIYSL